MAAPAPTRKEPTPATGEKPGETNGALARIALAVGGLGIRFRVLSLAVILGVTAALAPSAARIQQDDDVIRFLPEDDPRVVRFQDIGERFHGLSIAIVGLEATDGDLFTLERLALLRSLTRELAQIDGVASTTGLTELTDVVEVKNDDGSSHSEVWDLVGDLPKAGDEAASAAFLRDARARVLSRDHLVGALVSTQGEATIILCQLAPDASTKTTADAIRRITAERMAGVTGVRARFGGAPFIGSYAAEHTRRDLLALSPWVVAIVVLIMLITVRSLSGVAVALGAVAIAIVWVLGGLHLLGRTLTLVSSSLPVLLVALGSAYSVHLLASVLARVDHGAERADAVRGALRSTGPPILVAGITTAAGFVSFVVMDIHPMREFGLLMAVATMIIVLVTLTAVSAACMVLPLRPRAEGRAPRWALRAMVGGASAVSRRGAIAALVVAAISAGAMFFALRVEPHTDIRTLFADDSEPVEAERFLEERFGGSLFLQVEVSGDIKHPLVLRQIERFADQAARLEGVTNVQSIATPIVLAAGATTGERRIPPSRRTSASLAELVRTDAAVRLLVDGPWEHALVQIRLGGFDIGAAEGIAARLDEIAADVGGERVALPRAGLSEELSALERREVIAHVRSLLPAKADVSAKQLADILDDATLGPLRGEVAADLRLNLVDDPIVLLAPESSTDEALGRITDDVLTALSRGNLDNAHLMAILAPHIAAEEKGNVEGLREGVDFVLSGVNSVAHGKIRGQRVAAIMALVGGDTDGRLPEALERALWSLEDDVVFVPRAAISSDAAQPEEHPSEQAQLSFMVSGYPMVYVGMSESVQRNQVYSLLASGVLVFIALALFFRSALLALLALIPAALTLLLTFGAMGLLGIPMDVGTSMIAAIALGVGIDYAVHLVWRHGVPPRAEAQARLVDALGAAGWGIVINALEVSAGLSLLAFGTIVPMRNFGLLTASAMLVSAAATLLLVPALTHWLGAQSERARRTS